MIPRLLFFIVVLLPIHSLGQELNSVKTPSGEGAEYSVVLKSVSAKVMIYFVEAPSPGKKAVEMYFETPGVMSPIIMW